MKCHMIQMHQEESPYKCIPCDKQFPSRAGLECHTMSVHLKTRPYKCRFQCNSFIGYNDASNRSSHEKIKHGRLFTDLDRTDAECVEIEQEVDTKTNSDILNPAKRRQCNMCDKAFCAQDIR